MSRVTNRRQSKQLQKVKSETHAIAHQFRHKWARGQQMTIDNPLESIPKGKARGTRFQRLVQCCKRFIALMFI